MPFKLGTDHHLIQSGDWSELILFNGTRGWDEAHCAVAATTCRLLASRLEVVGRPSRESEEAPREAGSPQQVAFMRLTPGARLAWHTGTSNERLTVHLGLRVPSADDGMCALSIGGAGGSGGATTQVRWHEGHGIAFDDSFFHAAINNSTTTRYILYVTQWHPELGPFRAWKPPSKARSRTRVVEEL